MKWGTPESIGTELLDNLNHVLNEFKDVHTTHERAVAYSVTKLDNLLRAYKEALVVKIDVALRDSATAPHWQYRYKNAAGNWLITRRLYTEEAAKLQFEGSTEYEIHAGPFEVPT